MPRQASAAANRRTPLLADKPPPRRRIGEVAGGTAAECAAVWCCCPCAAMNVLVLALYKLPAGLCRRAWAARRRKKRGGGDGAAKRHRLDGSSRPRSAGGCGPTIEELERRLAAADVASGGDEEDEVWARFYGAGFWRSPSQRDSDS